MISIEIDNIKNFMSHLFIKDSLDYFLCKEINLQTFSSFNIDGSIAYDFLTDVEKEELNGLNYIPWSKLKPYCFNIIKGSRTPLSLKAVFCLPPNEIMSLIAESSLNINPDTIEGLYLNIRFENNKLTLISGSSLTYFTMDKTIDKLWDDALRKKMNFLVE